MSARKYEETVTEAGKAFGVTPSSVSRHLVQATAKQLKQFQELYASPERCVVFDINDFDETLPAPWKFDVKRLAASIVLECRDGGYDDGHAREAVRTATSSYANVMHALADESSLGTRSSLNFPVKSPYGSPRSVKLLIPSKCLAGAPRCEAARLMRVIIFPPKVLVA